ncbi:MAG: DUF6951 family protein [Butyricicoccus sp.]
MTKVEVNPGVCGMTAVLTAQSEDGMDVTISIDTPCEGCRSMVQELGTELDAYEVVFHRPGTGPVYEAASRHCPHGTCPVPAALLKCIEAECKLALPRDAEIRFLTE